MKGGNPVVQIQSSYKCLNGTGTLSLRNVRTSSGLMGMVSSKVTIYLCVNVNWNLHQYSVSPPQEHITGDQWWTDYQPVSYNLVSKRGDRTQFQKFVFLHFFRHIDNAIHISVWSIPVTPLEWESLQVYSLQHSRTVFLHGTFILDTLFNHMAGLDSGIGVGGSTFTHYNYPGIYQTQDFHHCGLEPGDDIVNYGNRIEVQTCELVNLAEWVTTYYSDIKV